MSIEYCDKCGEYFDGDYSEGYDESGEMCDACWERKQEDEPMKSLIEKLAPYRSGVVCDGLDSVSRLLCEEYPFVVHEFVSESEVNGWVLPQKWECDVATIKTADGSLIYDGNSHPLGVCAYSKGFVGEIAGRDLKKHLYYSQLYDDAQIYHTDWWYKNWANDWGLSIPKKIYDTIADDDTFSVELKTRFALGTMKVLEWVLPGKTTDSIVLNAHDCHPGCANDDLSGVAVGIELMMNLAEKKDRKYTYRLIVAPEHFGSIFYLDRFGASNLKFALFLESLGTTGPLALQRTFYGDTYIDRALTNALAHSGFEFRTDEFRKIVGNDETCWEGAGFEVPCASLSRVPFPEYHTSHDNARLMDNESLAAACQVVWEALEAMDQEMVMHRTFTGLVCLSNPKYDLYKPMLDPSMPDRHTITPMQRRWNYLMDCLPRYFHGKTTIMDIAERFEMPFRSVYDYVIQFENKGLITTEDVDINRRRPPVGLPPLLTAALAHPSQETT